MVIVCSHCQKTMPPDRQGHEIAVGWSVVRIELHNQKDLEIGYMYLCSGCMIQTTTRQIALPTSIPTAPSKTENA